MRDFRISDVSFQSANESQRREGVEGWVRLTLNDALRLDSIAVRRTRDGRLTLSYPERTDRHGRRHPTARPRDTEARVSLDEQILEAIRAMGFVL